MDYIIPYSEAKLKVYLKQTTQRVKLANNKRSTASSRHKREIGKLLENGKSEKAIIRIEHVVRDDYTMEAYEIVELMCDLLYERIRQITKGDVCPPDLTEAVSTVIYVSTRLGIAELEEARKQFRKKYGKEFVELCTENSRGTVNPRVVEKLNLIAPSPLLVRRYAKEIAKEFCVPWDDDTFPITEDGNYRDGFQVGYSVPLAPSSGLESVYQQNMSQNIPTQMSSALPGYDDAQLHPTTEVGLHQPQNQLKGSYYEEEQPPQYNDVMKDQGNAMFTPPVPPAQQQGVAYQQQNYEQQVNQQPQFQQQYQAPQNQQQQQFVPQVQEQQQQQEQTPPPMQQQQQEGEQQNENPSSSDTTNDSSNSGPSYDDLMARFKNLKN